MELKYILNYIKHRKEMEKQGKGSQARVGFIKGLIDKKTEDIIATRDGETTALERIKIKREVEADLKKSIRRVGLTVAAIAVAVGISAKVTNVLTEGKYEGIEITENGVNIDSAEVGNINVELDENSNSYNSINISKNDFDESLKVDVNNLEQIQNLVVQDEILKENVENEVDSFETSEDVLDYLKEMYIEKYNQENHTDYTINDIKIEKPRTGIEFYEDKAENGDSIVRVKDAEDWLEDNNMGLVKVFVDGSLVEKGTIYNGEYQNVYRENESVAEAKEANILGKVLSTGKDYEVALINKEENSVEKMQTYKKRFKSAILEYRQAKIDQIINQKTTEETSQAENGEEERY